jgi:OPT family oligopeptide transporter
MAIRQLTEEQVRTMTVEEKDRWWLENVYKGDVPQFTVRAGVCGFFLGGLLSVTNLYVGAKTGWTLGVGITSVILAFAIFRFLIRVGLAKEYSVLENNIMQSIACAAGYMTAPLISSLSAYMIVMGAPIPWLHCLAWLIVLALLGVLFAFPMKRRFINDEQHPFPEGRAAGVVMDTLHEAGEGEGNLAPKVLIWSGITAALAKLGQAERVLESIRFQFRIPEYLDGPFHALAARFGWTPGILGTSLQQLTIRPELDIAMMGAGGLMGIRTGVSLMVGAVLNYFVLAPIMIQHGDILGTINASGETVYGFRQITYWALWGGVAMMTTASLFAFFSKPAMLLNAFKGMLGGRRATEDVVKHIELPMGVFVIGIPLVGAVTVWMAGAFFSISWYWAAIAIPLVFVFCLIAANSTALTSITPTGAMGKLTQLTFAMLARGEIGTNLMTAGITGEVASNSSNLLMNIKPGYMLGGKPRLQALGHSLGVFAGAFAAVGVFYSLFLRGNPDNLISEEFPMPAAAIWKAVAEILTQGLSALPVTAAYAALIGGLLGILMEIVKRVSKGKFGISAIGVGLAMVIPFTTCLAMAFGAFVFWALEKRNRDPESRVNRIVIKNQEPICAGVIAGAALMGIAVMAYTTFVLGG